MYAVGKQIIISATKQIKVIQEIERFEEDIVIYTTDGTAHGIRDCRTVNGYYKNK